MTLKVYFSDGTIETYEDATFEEVADHIVETITGCDFAIHLDKVEELADDGKVRQLFPSWSLKLTREI